MQYIKRGPPPPHTISSANPSTPRLFDASQQITQWDDDLRLEKQEKLDIVLRSKGPEFTCKSGKGQRRLLAIKALAYLGADMRLIHIGTLGQVLDAVAIDGDHLRALRRGKNHILLSKS